MVEKSDSAPILDDEKVPVKPNENTEKLKKLMRQLSEQSPKMSGNSNSLTKRYTKIFVVVSLYW